MKHATQAMLTMMITAASLVGCGSMPASKKSSVRGSDASGDYHPFVLNLAGAVGLAVAPSKASLALANSSGSFAPTAEEKSNSLLKIAEDGTLSSAYGTPLGVEKNRATQEWVTPQVSQVWSNKNLIVLKLAKAIPLVSPEKDQTAYDEKTGIYTCWNGVVSAEGPGACIAPPSCLLGYADKTDGIVRCVDSALTSFDGNGQPILNPVQFDNAGNIYFGGSFGLDGKLKMFDISTHQLTTVTTAQLGGFNVNASGDMWFKYVFGLGVYYKPANGKVTKISGLNGFAWVTNFPDGKTYMGSLDTVSKLDGTTTTKYCDCAGGQVYTTSSGKVVEIGLDKVTQIYPTVTPLAPISMVTGAVGNSRLVAHSGSTIVLAGQDSGSNYKLQSYNVDTQKQVDLIPDNSIQVRSLGIKGNTVYFSGTKGGLGLDDISAVSGKINLDTKELTSHNIPLFTNTFSQTLIFEP